MFTRIIFLSGLIFLGLTGYAKENEAIFPDLTGQELLDSLIYYYKTDTVLPYSIARDTLFSNIYQHNDSLICVYSGYTIYLDPQEDPTQDAYSKGIDTEHTWPQSKGSVGQAKSDMFHLYPTRVVVNSSRGNDPFAEIPDPDTDKWFRLDYYLTTIPTEFIDEYSEKDEGAYLFEPREDHKGNVARAMFYFYTMYKRQADSLDPEYFGLQKDVLYQWHLTDTVDSMERIRNDLIASYQGDKKNPYILDSSLVRRAYFYESTVVTGDYELLTNDIILEQNYPNPFSTETVISYRLSVISKNHKPITGYRLPITLFIYDLTGRIIRNIPLRPSLIAPHSSVVWDGRDNSGENVPGGVYFYRLNIDGDNNRFTQTKTMILLR
ncbi:endonuclease [candidate division WOR-3 bacterium]|nr:endonuclease [candidate division WOR-3 bacterium]